MNIEIRKAARSDAMTIARFNALMAEETEHRTLDEERLVFGVHGLFDNPSYGFYVVAEVNKEIVGQLMITYEWSDWRNGVFWWIQSVFVKKEFRSLGVFRRLFEHILERSKSEGNVCGLRLYVEKENLRARQIYGALGMKTTVYDLLEMDFVL